MKLVKYCTYIVIFISLLCLYSGLIFMASQKGSNGSVIHKTVLKFAKFPQKIEEVFNSPEVTNVPITYTKADTSFKEVNKLQYDLFGTTSFWNDKLERWDINLINFRNDEIVSSWYFEKKNFVEGTVPFSYSLIKNSLVLEDKQLVSQLYHSPNLFKLDSNSNIIWHNSELSFHHSLNIDHNGNIWTCAREIFRDKYETNGGGLVKNLDGDIYSYREEIITNVDVNTGKILFEKGVAAILIENGYRGLIYGGELYDPLHINDIQPALNNTKHWRKGDVFVSIRNRSLIILYRPSTNKILKLIQGPFINQHDVDIIADNEIAIFNNNVIFSKGYDVKIPYTQMDSLPSNEIIVYNFDKDSFSIYDPTLFIANNIKTHYQGLSEFLDNGDLFVEDYSAGKYYVINGKNLIMEKVLYTSDPKFIHKPSWTRIYTELPF